MHPFNFYNIFSSGFIALIVFTLEHTPTHCSPVIENICSHRGEVSYLHILSTKTSPKVFWEAVKLSWKIKFFICCPQSVHTKRYLMLICLLWLTVLVNEWLAKQTYMLCHLYCGSEGRKFDSLIKRPPPRWQIHERYSLSVFRTKDSQMRKQTSSSSVAFKSSTQDCHDLPDWEPIIFFFFKFPTK